MSVTVEGHLLADAAHVTFGPDRAAGITLTINAGRGMPFEVRHVVGATPESHINAERLAQAMRCGLPCTVVAERVEPRSDHGAAVLVLRQASAIRCGQWELL